MIWRGPCWVRGVTARRPTRSPGVSYVGIQRYSLRLCTYGRARLFASREFVQVALTQIQRTCDDEAFELLAYCFMPDHVHLVVEGKQPTSDFKNLASLMKQRTAYAFRTWRGVPLLWQDSCFERVLRNDEATAVVIRYVYDNPVRAGLVRRYQDYPFLGGKSPPDSC